MPAATMGLGRRAAAALLTSLALGLAGPIPAARAEYPERVIRLIHGFAPGGLPTRSAGSSPKRWRRSSSNR